MCNFWFTQICSSCPANSWVISFLLKEVLSHDQVQSICLQKMLKEDTWKSDNQKRSIGFLRPSVQRVISVSIKHLFCRSSWLEKIPGNKTKSLSFWGTIPEHTEREDWINLLCFNKKQFLTSWWSSSEDMKVLAVLPQGPIIHLFQASTSIRERSVTGLLKVTECNITLFSILLSQTSQKSSLECYSTKTYFTDILFKEFILSWRMFCLLGLSADVFILHHASCRAKSLWYTTNSTPQ